MNDFSGWSHDELMAALAACERERARLDAREAQVLAALAAEPVPAHEKGYVRDEVAATMRWSASVTHARFEVAEGLSRLPATMAALQDGQISIEHARALTDSLVGLDTVGAAELEAAVLPYALNHDVYDTRRKVAREFRKFDPLSAEERLELGLARRSVWSMPEEPGVTRFGALLPAEGAAQLMHALAFMAQAAKERDIDDGRTKQQRMADALVQLAKDVLAGGCAHCELPTRRLGPAVNVTVALSTLLGLDAQPGELNGEPIPAELARTLASDPNGTWRRLLTDEAGQLLDYGRNTYRPPANLRDHVVARDRTCRFPGCHRRASACELDHVVAWTDSGTTAPGNILALCPRHHHLNHEAGGWRVRRLPDGGVEWASPVGDVVVDDQALYPVDTTAARVVVANDYAMTESIDAIDFDAYWLTDLPDDLLAHPYPDAIVVTTDNAVVPPPF